MKGCLSGCRKFFTWPVLFICGGLFVLSSLFPSETTQIRRTQTAEASLPTVASLAAVGENLTATAIEVADLATEAPTEAPTATITPTEAPSATITPTEIVVQQQAAALPTLAPREDTPVPPAAAQVQAATLDFAAIQATSDALSGPIEQVLVPLSGINDITSVSVLMSNSEAKVHVEIISLNDNEAFMEAMRNQIATVQPDMGQLQVMVLPNDRVGYGNFWTWERDLGWDVMAFGQTPVPVVTSVRVEPTAIPAQVRGMSPETYHTTGGANIRSCARTNCNAIAQLSANTAITVNGQINGEAVSAGNSVWYRINHGGQEAYIYSGLVRRGLPPAAVQQPPAQSQQQPPAQQPPAQAPSGNTRRPANCAEAVAWGLSDVEAGRWSHLDRDGDGVACYGD